MCEYGINDSSTIRDLISQMALEMEKKAKECQSLREEIAKKDSEINRASERIRTLEARCRRSADECMAAKRDLDAAQEEREKIAVILGYKDNKASTVRLSLKSIPDPSVEPSDTYRPGRHADETSDLSGFAKATLDRMREYN